jgi:hypothetical protein
VRKRSRSWQWALRAPSGEVIVAGRERSRAAANYRAARCLFLLLSATPVVRRGARRL